MGIWATARKGKIQNKNTRSNLSIELGNFRTEDHAKGCPIRGCAILIRLKRAQYVTRITLFEVNSGWSHQLVPLPHTPTYLAKYPALTLCQILNAMWKHIFLNKLLIRSRVINSFILLFIIYNHFISFLPACKFYSFSVFIFNLF